MAPKLMFTVGFQGFGTRILLLNDRGLSVFTGGYTAVLRRASTLTIPLNGRLLFPVCLQSSFGSGFRALSVRPQVLGLVHQRPLSASDRYA
ncbi:unnamed protein product [Danaus chrysippus]|uniref:(African queen) hypothetical protein n=1 Tax=Danaus chrysippus TaxID=151541 RepID=A0A8J2QDA9_9NEOP|nr:unnamed protein product [Danaus chrysippus]